jgi:hypothetical protein
MLQHPGVNLQYKTFKTKEYENNVDNRCPAVRLDAEHDSTDL